MGAVELISVSICIVMLAIVFIRGLKIGEKHRDASEFDGSLRQRIAAHYFRRRDPLEIVTLGAAPLLFIFFLWLWSVLWAS
jgi:hypothetical protein